MKILLNGDFCILKEWLALFLRVIMELKFYTLSSFLSLESFYSKYEIKLNIYHCMIH